MPELLENADEKLSTGMRRLLDFLGQEWKGLQVQIESLNTDLEQIAGSDAACVRLQPRGPRLAVCGLDGSDRFPLIPDRDLTSITAGWITKG
jgi:hypothetical protein